MAAARHASVSKVMVLCERHPRRLIPGMLTLLACYPETVAADSYSQLLTLVSFTHMHTWSPQPHAGEWLCAGNLLNQQRTQQALKTCQPVAQAAVFTLS